jgi:hypothetical protein
LAQSPAASMTSMHVATLALAGGAVAKPCKQWSR